MLVRSFVQSSEQQHNHSDDVAMVADQSSVNETRHEVVELSDSSVVINSDTSNLPLPNTVAENNETGDGSDHPMEEEEPLSEEQNLQISQFCEMTGAEPAYAKTVLQVEYCLKSNFPVLMIVVRLLPGMLKQLSAFT